ncbi:hypothetical protein Xen7305DRAFT_00021600 [Xenococcus sp. PCC 7305]|uniref:hypothetical protein n=1 Tax=Xenococcus sp. PCC 7305 TaxID=102125 RepID=UPI0002AC9B00|nr:hypothetical protein [Xenococcus sp. PCC 7305]ELS02446.1 hypothetical protein Xen7305DRAFT_00021600 [Xenococcus sp. PCC 7305]
MQTIKLKSHVGDDGILHLDVPTDVKNAELEVVVTFNNPIPTSENRKKLKWSPGFFDKTAGAWEGAPLQREPQGEYESREKLF